MAAMCHLFENSLFLLIVISVLSKSYGNDILGCGGFVKSHVTLDYSKIEIALYTRAGSLKERTECAPNNGYYFLPLYEKGEYTLKVHPPPGWSFEPSKVDLSVDGSTDPCSTNQDINFSFNGFGITGRVITAGQTQGPSGIAVQLINDRGEKRDTATSVGGDFHFTPVIPGKYTLKASHPRWKLDPAQALVQVKEGNTVLPVGVLAVKGYDVKGSIISYGNPIGGIYVLLYSKQENPKFRVEGCKTSLLQGVPDSPICHTITDSNGEFTFGLVPAGEYRLLALAQTPGQTTIRYNIKPDAVPFTIAHDSLYIKNAFEVTGFTLVGSVSSSPNGAGLPGARVLKDGQPVGNTDAAGKFILPSLQPGTYTLSFQHEQCEFDDVALTISPTGPTGAVAARAARWRVCGSVTPADRRDVIVSGPGGARVKSVPVTKENGGKWCTFLPSGVYSAKVDVAESEQREGLQFYPLTQKISVGHAPVDGVAFSQLKAKVTGTVLCKLPKDCENLVVTLKPLSPDGGYVGQPMTTVVKDGEFTFPEVLPGSAEVSVPATRLCWAESRHNVALAAAAARVPAFRHAGYGLRVHSSHHIEVEYSSQSSKGVLTVPAGDSEQCVPEATRYTLTPRGPHRFRPAQAHADTSGNDVSSVQFVAIAHAVVQRVVSPVPVTDLVLRVSSDSSDGAAMKAVLKLRKNLSVQFVAIAHAVVLRVVSPVPVTDLVLRVSSDSSDGAGMKDVGPLVPLQRPGGGYAFEHTLYMADGEVAVVSAHSRSLLFSPAGPQQVLGRALPQHEALVLRAVRGLTLAGALAPPVPAVTVTLTSGDMKLTQITTEDGTYSFGPLDASKHYTITAEKESYVFGERDENGIIAAHKLAEIIVQLVDEADDSPLQGALVSVSGGSYRRTAASGAEGSLRFPALTPAQYYVKPNMKEYRFTPPHRLQPVAEGRTHHVTLRGVRVAWSCLGHLVSLGGLGWAGATLVAFPEPISDKHCVMEEATTESNGAFRIRGLLPKCVYTLQLKESNLPEIRGLMLAKAPPTLEVEGNKDIVDARLIAIQPNQITDATVLVHTPSLEHYKTLRLSLALEDTPHTPVYSTKLDPAGYSQYLNPGLMYVLPRLPADNKTYVLQLESTLSKSTHSYGEQVYYFNSDGKYKAFTIEFLPKVKSSEQELRQTSLLVIPLLGLIVLAYFRRDQLLLQLSTLAANSFKAPARVREPHKSRQELLDKASIDQILSTVNAAGKRTAKKKVQ